MTNVILVNSAILTLKSFYCRPILFVVDYSTGRVQLRQSLLCYVTKGIYPIVQVNRSSFCLFLLNPAFPAKVGAVGVGILPLGRLYVIQKHAELLCVVMSQHIPCMKVSLPANLANMQGYPGGVEASGNGSSYQSLA